MESHCAVYMRRQEEIPWRNFNVVVALHQIDFQLAFWGRKENSLVDFKLYDGQIHFKLTMVHSPFPPQDRKALVTYSWSVFSCQPPRVRKRGYEGNHQMLPDTKFNRRRNRRLSTHSLRPSVFPRDLCDSVSYQEYGVDTTWISNWK